MDAGSAKISECATFCRRNEDDAPADGRTRVLLLGAAAKLAPATGVTQSRFAYRNGGGTIWLLRSN